MQRREGRFERVGEDEEDAEVVYKPSGYEQNRTNIGLFCGWLGQGMMCCMMCPPYKSVEQGEDGLVTRFGKFERKVSSGLVYINPCTESLQTVDTKLRVFDLDRQHVTTRDNLSLSIDCVLGYRIVDSYKVTYTVARPHDALIQFCYTTLRHIIGNKTLQECLASREQISDDARAQVEAYAQTIGVHIETIGFKDIIIPKQIQDAISSAAIARRTAESNIINADANLSVSIKNAEADMAVKLKNSEANFAVNMKNAESDMAVRLKQAEANMAVALKTTEAQLAVAIKNKEVEVVKAQNQVAALLITAEGEVRKAELDNKSAMALGSDTAKQIKYMSMMTDVFANQSAGKQTFFFPSNMPVIGSNLLNTSMLKE